MTPCSITSGRPPTFEATTGTSQAIASSAARPKLSCADGSRNTSAPTARESPPPARRASRRRARRRARAPAEAPSPSSGPSPTSRSRAGTARGCARTPPSPHRRASPAGNSRRGSRASSPSSAAKRWRRSGTGAGGEIAVEEVGDHFDVARSAELATRVASRRLSDTAVTPSDCSIENATISEIRRIAADQRDVRSVKRRHDLRHGRDRLDAEHLLRQLARRSRAESA